MVNTRRSLIYKIRIYTETAQLRMTLVDFPWRTVDEVLHSQRVNSFPAIEAIRDTFAVMVWTWDAATRNLFLSLFLLLLLLLVVVVVVFLGGTSGYYKIDNDDCILRDTYGGPKTFQRKEWIMQQNIDWCFKMEENL